MTKIFILLLAFVAFGACGSPDVTGSPGISDSSNASAPSGTSDIANDTDFPKEIRTAKQPEHINIPGTRLFIIPPEGFTISSTRAAIEKDEITSIMVVDLVGESYYLNGKRFNKERFKEIGVKAFEFQEFSLNGFPAKLAFVEETPGAYCYSLVFGDSNFAAIVKGDFKIYDTKSKEQIKQALLSIYYDTLYKYNPFVTASFVLDDTKSVFKFAKATDELYMFSINAVKQDTYENEPYFIVLNIPFQKKTLKSVADSMASVLHDKIFTGGSDSKTNGLPSFKRIVKGVLIKREVVFFQHIVQINDRVIIMQGMASDNFEKYIKEFEKLSNTIRPK